MARPTCGQAAHAGEEGLEDQGPGGGGEKQPRGHQVSHAGEELGLEDQGPGRGGEKQPRGYQVSHAGEEARRSGGPGTW